MSMQQKQNNRKRISILAILVGIIVARLSCVALSNIPLFTMGFVLAYALLFVLLFMFSLKSLSGTEACALLSVLTYTFEVVFSCLIAKKGLFETQAFNAYILVILFFLYLYVKRLPREKQKVFFVIAMLGFVFTFVYSIIKLIEDPTLSRLAATGRYGENSADTLSAIGGFDTAYGGLLVFVVLAYLWTVVRSKKGKLGVAMALASCIVFIIMATYATAIVLLFFALALIIFKKNKMAALLILLAVGIAFVFRESIGNGIMQWSESITYSDVFKEKMYQIGYMIRYGESVGTLAGEEGRWARIGWSLQTFTQYPLFGGFTVQGAKIGSHSEIADLLGRFGILGFASLLAFFVLLLKDIAQGLSTKLGKKLLFVAILLYLAIAVLDPALYTQQILPIFLLIPFTEKWVKVEENAL